MSRYDDWREYYDAIGEVYRCVDCDIARKEYIDDTERAYLEKISPMLETLEEIIAEAMVYAYNRQKKWWEANQKYELQKGE